MTELPTGEAAGGPTSQPTPAASPPERPPTADREPGGDRPGGDGPDGPSNAAKRRRRGSRGGRNRSRPRPEGVTADQAAKEDDRNPELPDTPHEGRPKTVEAA